MSATKLEFFFPSISSGKWILFFHTFWMMNTISGPQTWEGRSSTKNDRSDGQSFVKWCEQIWSGLSCEIIGSKRDPTDNEILPYLSLSLFWPAKTHNQYFKIVGLLLLSLPLVRPTPVYSRHVLDLYENWVCSPCRWDSPACICPIAR